MTRSVAILIFARAPLPGAAKTRLIPALGAAGAAALHARLLADTLARACAAGIGPVQLWATPDCVHPGLQDLTRRWRVRCRRQQGADLGARLAHAAAAALGRHRGVLLIGCDCPELTPDYLVTAATALRDHDAVLGPAADGGYVLLGLRQFSETLFDAMPWGGPEVAALTGARLDALGWRWRTLPVLHDIDRPEDLVWLPADQIGQ